ncbi:MAG: tetratricopeptide repeat protein [Planctomycetes bacterium]|nr:tetratricopeptide repeat protein [Planctomycetota bacterium]
MDLGKLIERAEDATRRKNYDGAITLYHQLLDLQPNSAEGRRGLRAALLHKWERRKTSKLSAVLSGLVPLISAGLGRLLRQHRSVARSLERYLVHDPLNLGKNLALGRALERAGCPAGAAEVFEFIAGQNGSSGEAWKAAGALRAELGDVQQALEDYEQALELNPRDQEALKARKNLAAEGALQNVAYDRGQHSRSLAANQDELRELERAKRRHLSDEELTEEIERVEGQLAENPRDPQILKRLGELHERRSDVEAALDCYRLVVDYDPKDVDTQRKVTDLEIQRFDAKIQGLRERESRGEAGAAEERQRVEQERARFELEQLERQVETHPTDMELRFRLGRALFQENEVDRAIAELQKSVNDPRVRTDSLVTLGQCFFKKKMFDLARAQLEKALESLSGMGPRVKEILYNLGVISEKMDDLEGARSFYARIFEADIQYRDISQKMERLNAR